MGEQDEIIEINKRLRILASNIFGSRDILNVDLDSKSEDSFFFLKERSKITKGKNALFYFLKDDSYLSNYFWESIAISQISKLKHNNTFSLPDLAFLLSLAEKNNNLLKTNESKDFLSNLRKFIIWNGLITNSSGGVIQLSGIDEKGTVINLTNEDRKLLIDKSKQELLDVLLLSMGIVNPPLYDAYSQYFKTSGKLDSSIKYLKSHDLLKYNQSDNDNQEMPDLDDFQINESSLIYTAPALNEGIAILDSLLGALEPYPDYVDGIDEKNKIIDLWTTLNHRGFKRTFRNVSENYVDRSLKENLEDESDNAILFFSRGLKDLQRHLSARKRFEEKITQSVIKDSGYFDAAIAELETEDEKKEAKEFMEDYPAISLDDVCNLIFSTNKKTIKNATIDKSSKLEFSSTSRKYLRFQSALEWLTDDERLNQIYLFTSQESFPTERITLKTLKQSVE